MEGLIIQLISGGVGGNLAGMLLKKFNMGWIWNTVAGVLGGGLGGQALGALGMLGEAAGDPLSIAGIGGSAVGGGILMTVIGLVKQMMAQKQSA